MGGYNPYGNKNAAYRPKTSFSSTNKAGKFGSNFNKYAPPGF